MILSLFAFMLCLPKAVYGQELFQQESAALVSQVEKMYSRGLQYLVDNQHADGYWLNDRYGREPGVVGLVIVAILAHGDDPNHGPYQKAIKAGLEFILDNQSSKTGYIGRTMYNHGFATLALAECYGAIDDARLGPALEKAVQLILGSQKENPVNAWRYSPESQDADTTVSGAQMVALFAARNAGVPVPDEAIQQGVQYMRNCQDTNGGIGYTSSRGPNAPRTAIGCLVLALAKEKESKAFKSAFNYLKQTPQPSHYKQYYLYYASQAFFHASPNAWETWNLKNINSLGKEQNADGSWDGQFGQVFGTSTSLLSLALNYRFLPIYER